MTSPHRPDRIDYFLCLATLLEVEAAKLTPDVAGGTREAWSARLDLSRAARLVHSAAGWYAHEQARDDRAIA